MIHGEASVLKEIVPSSPLPGKGRQSPPAGCIKKNNKRRTRHMVSVLKVRNTKDLWDRLSLLFDEEEKLFHASEFQSEDYFIHHAAMKAYEKVANVLEEWLEVEQ